MGEIGGPGSQSLEEDADSLGPSSLWNFSSSSSSQDEGIERERS